MVSGVIFSSIRTTFFYFFRMIRIFYLNLDFQFHPKPRFYSYLKMNNIIIFSGKNNCNHTHKKQKDRLKVSLDQVLFAAKLELLKILVHRLPQNSSSVNIEGARKLKQRYSLCAQLLGTLTYLYFIILILIYFSLIMTAVDYVTYGCPSSRTNPGVIIIQELHTGGKTLR